MFESFSAIGFFVQRPCGPRKSGMPDSVEMPAPVSATSLRALRTQPRTRSISASTNLPTSLVQGPPATRNSSTLDNAREIALEHRYMYQRFVAGIGPQVVAAKTDVVRPFVFRVDAVRVRVRERIGRRFADDDAGLATDVPRHSHVSGYMVVLDPNVIATFEGVP